MDINACLLRLRNAIKEIAAVEKAIDLGESNDFDLYAYWVTELMESASELDLWLSKGGFLPDAWGR